MKNKEGNPLRQNWLRIGSWKRIPLIGGSFFLMGGVVFLAIMLLLPQQVDVSKLDTVTITVTRMSGDTPVTSSVIFQKTIHDSQKVQKIYQQINSLHQVKPGENYNCPAGLFTYNVFRMDFFAQGKNIAQATNSVTDCSFWKVKVGSNGNSNQYCCTSDALWLQWHQQLGLPAPYTNKPL